MRARMSEPPPGANRTISRIDWAGYDWPKTAFASANEARARSVLAIRDAFISFFRALARRAVRQRPGFLRTRVFACRGGDFQIVEVPVGHSLVHRRNDH